MLQPVALTAENNGLFSFSENGNKKFYKYCSNQQYAVCNWLVPAESEAVFCKACEPNRIIPDLGNAEYFERWQKIENAKHRLVYQLLRMPLPFVSQAQDEQTGLAFDFMSDEITGDHERVLTGHDNGVITINIAEADDIEREMARKHMYEAYRTVLGHFRHEIGHYYWDRLIDNTDMLYSFRNVFGDETIDYANALKKYYAEGIPVNWSENYISAYASMHPWEDWAETWAHYMHIIDTLETAYSFGLSVNPIVTATKRLRADIKSDPYTIDDFESIMDSWLPLTLAVNSLNRSMGLGDIYPFVITAAVKGKMKFIHELVKNNSRKAS